MTRNIAIPARLLLLFLLLVASDALCGCGSDGIIGQQASSQGGLSETTFLKSDGTFQQKFTDKFGKTLTNTGTWQKAPPLGIPGIPQDDSYIELVNYADLHDLKGRLPETANGFPHTSYITSKSDFSLSREQRQQSQQSVAFWVIALRLAFLVFWIVEIIDVARREFPTSNAKVGWVLVVVLLGCLGALIYYIFGKVQGTLPKQDAAQNS